MSGNGVIVLRERFVSGYPELLPAVARPALEAAPVCRRSRVVAWARSHVGDLAMLLPVLVVAGVVHGFGMGSYPQWVDDPGTYLSQAWSFAYHGTLSPYAYFYDHTPGGWIQMGLWAKLTGGFDRYATAVGFGNECMLFVKIVSAGLLVLLARRLGLTRPGAAAVGLIFALSPLALTYTRWTYLDNLVTPWLLLAFVLALAPRRGMAAGVGAGLCFAMACLTKETALLVAPAFVWAMLQHSDRRNRAHVLAMSLGATVVLASLYVVYAATKSELFSGPGHVSLLGTARWQLVGREHSGRVFDPDTVAHSTFFQWYHLDPAILLAGAAGALVALSVPVLRPIVAVLGLASIALVAGGYLPAMQIVNLLPWCALLAVAGVEVLLGRDGLRPAWTVGRPRRRPVGRWRRRAGFGALAAVLAATAVLVVPAWTSSVVRMTTATGTPPLAEATTWVARNAPRTSVVVVNDSVWTDLVHKYGFPPKNVIMSDKLDTDPAVQADLRRIDYVVVPNRSLTKEGGVQTAPTLIEARRHGVPVVSFGGPGDDGVSVWHVASSWNPRP